MEAEIFRPDDELRRLARRAVELGVTRVQQNVSADDIIATLKQSARRDRRARGARGLATSVFNINVRRFYHYHRAWNDDLSIAVACLPEYIKR